MNARVACLSPYDKGTVRAMFQGRHHVDVFDEVALVEALRAGHLEGAGLDVYEVAPLPVDSPLRTMENVVLSPHAKATVEADARLLEMVGDNLRRVLEGHAPLNVVNAVKVGAQ